MRRSWSDMPNSYWSTSTTLTRGSAEWPTNTFPAWLRCMCYLKNHPLCSLVLLLLWILSWLTCHCFHCQVPTPAVERACPEDHAGHSADSVVVSECCKCSSDAAADKPKRKVTELSSDHLKEGIVATVTTSNNILTSTSSSPIQFHQTGQSMSKPCP